MIKAYLRQKREVRQYWRTSLFCLMAAMSTMVMLG
jgi:hypothetical protein